MVGAEMKSFLPMKGYSDGLLLELKKEIPLDYRVYYSGWDAAPTVWPRGASIHHPSGDATKISLFDGGVSITTWSLDSDSPRVIPRADRQARLYSMLRVIRSAH